MEPPAFTNPLKNARVLITLVGVAMALLMGALENTVVGTAMPTIVANLGGLEIYSWVFAAYILAATVMTPIWGKVADLFGRRPAMFGGLALFILGSALSGASRTMHQLIGFRIIQGLGAAALFPVGMTIVADLLTLEQRTKIIGLFSGMWGIASLIGPWVGGFLTEYSRFSWRSCFYIILPAGLLSAAMIGATYRERAESREKVSFDVLGTAVLSAAMMLLLFIVERGGELPAIVKVVALFVCGALLAFFVHIERRHPEPLVPLELFRNRMVTMATVNGMFVMMALIGTMSFLPLFVQAVIGTSAVEAGNILMPLIVPWVLASIVGGRWILRFGYKPLVLAGMASILFGAALLSRVSTHTTRLELAFSVVFMGIGGGLTVVTMMIGAQQSVPNARLGVATSTVQFARNIGSAIGVAAMGALMSGSLKTHLARAPQELARFANESDLASIVRPETRAALSATASEFLRGSMADSLRGAFTFVFAIAIAGTITALFVPAGFAHELTHEERQPRSAQSQGEDNSDGSGDDDGSDAPPDSQAEIEPAEATVRARE